MIHTFDFRFPFYYEVKILLLIWLISPVSRGSLGSSIIYRKFVHPALMKREDVSCIPECYIKTYIKCELIRSINFPNKEIFRCLCPNFAISQFETSVVGIKSSPRTFSLLPSSSSFTSDLKVMRPFSSFPQKIPGTRLAKHGLLFMACTNLGALDCTG